MSRMAKDTRIFFDTCACGKELSLPEATAARHQEIACSCGRRTLYGLGWSGWTARAVLTPEGSVPVGGFSKGLRLEPDVQRFRFLHRFGGASLPVHIVFSPSLRIAEIKAADRKIVRLEEVGSVSEACRIWLERREVSSRRQKFSPSSWLTRVEPLSPEV